MADRDKLQQKTDPWRQRPALAGSGTSVASLTELEIALMEMIEFGIDQWNSSGSRDIAASLLMRGLLAGKTSPPAAGPLAASYSVTAKGRKLLRQAKSGARKAARPMARHLVS